MKIKFFFFFLASIGTYQLSGQNRKIDTTLKMGAAGYHVYCSNKSAENNITSVKPIGFENTAQEMNFMIKGRVTKAEIEDFNNDGFPDLILYVYNGEGGVFGSAIGLSSNANKSCGPIYFPDILDDVKLRVGYQGHDEYYLLEGTLMRSFPIFKADDAKDKPTGGKRVIQYHMIPTEREGVSKFKVLRTYDKQ